LAKLNSLHPCPYNGFYKLGMQTYFKTLAPTLSPISLDTYIYQLLPQRIQKKPKRDKSESFTGDSTWIVRDPHLMKQT
jgi:hypothetical protein